jgi:dienelactone hydrolase
MSRSSLFILCLWAQSVFASGLGELPMLDDASLSPDGDHLLLLQSNGETYDLAVENVVTGKRRLILSPTPEQGLLNWCRWANKERIVCSTRTYNPMPRVGIVTATRMVAVDLDGSDLLPLIPKPRNMVGRAPSFNPQIQDRVISWLPEDPAHILVQLNRQNPNRPSVYRLNINDNSLVRVRRARSQIRQWYADFNGDVRLGVGFRDQATPVVFRMKAMPTAYTGAAFNSEIPPVPLGFSLDGQQIFMNMTDGRDRHGIYRVRYSDGEVLGTIHTDPDFDVFGSLVQHPETGEPVGVRYMRHHPHTVWFDQELAALFSSLERHVPGKHHQLISVDDDYTLFLFHAYGGISPGYFLVDRAAGKVIEIGRDYPHLTDEAVVDIVPVEYPSRDGTKIPGYLAVPKHAARQRLPTVVLPHGGPYDRDSARFDPWVQYLNDLGIAVLKPNFRGSVGYGELFMQAGYQQWGKRMQEDLVDGIDWMVKEGIADPDRICVVGASYGGFTALVSAYKYADRVRCAVSLAGISDLDRLVRRIQDFDLVNRNRDRIQSGDDLQANSPFRHAAAFSVPVLLVHGDRDTVVDVEHSREMADQLKQVDKPFKYIEQPGGDHFLSGGAQRRAFYAAMAEFLSTYLGLNVKGPELAETGARPTRKSADSTSPESTEVVN